MERISLRQRDDWPDLCRKKFDLAADALEELARREKWFPELWEPALWAWSEGELAKQSWDRLSPLVAQAPEESLQNFRRGAASWLRGVARRVNTENKLFLKLCQVLLALKYDDDLQDGDPLTAAINHPVGHVTEALLDWGFRPARQDHNGIPDNLQELFGNLCNTEVAAYRHGRVLLALRAIALFRADQDWTIANLVPMFDWERNRSEAPAIWSGFLHSARLHVPFLETIKTPFLQAAQHYKVLNNLGGRYAFLLTFAALDRIETFLPEHLKRATGQLPDDGLQHAVWLLVQMLDDADENREEYWRKRVRPYMNSIWPRTRKSRGRLVRERLAELCVAAGGELPDAVDTIKPWLSPVSDYSFAVTQLHEAGLCKQFPSDSLDLLSRTVDTETPWGPPSKLQACLSEIKETEISLEKDPRYMELVLYVRRRGGNVESDG